MEQVKENIRFTEYFGVKKSQHEVDFVDIPLNAGDIPLFLDPYALSLREDRWSVESNQLIISFFQQIISELRNGNDSLVKYMLEHLHEPNETKLGLSRGNKSQGKGVSGIQSQKLFRALKKSKAVKTGVLSHLEECDLFIEGIARDKISDICTNIIKIKLIEYTQAQCKLHNIPTRGCSIGLVWDTSRHRWRSQYWNLPVYENEDAIILVPKSIVRFNLSLSHVEYYRKFVLEFLQEDYYSKGSLLRVLKNGDTRPPYKKTLEEKYPLSKEYLLEFSEENPQILKDYKKYKADEYDELSNSDIADATANIEKFDYRLLIKQLDDIKPGNKDANKFHDYAIGALEAIFYPELMSPTKEDPIHSGRKKIDITFCNSAREGFFEELSRIKKVPCPFIFFECKNYSADPSNPELDQLAGRFSPNRGRFGILVCRSFQDKELFYKRCNDTASDDRGFIIALDDNDLKLLLKFKSEGNTSAISKLLNGYYKRIVM